MTRSGAWRPPSRARRGRETRTRAARRRAGARRGRRRRADRSALPGHAARATEGRARDRPTRQAERSRTRTVGSDFALASALVRGARGGIALEPLVEPRQVPAVKGQRSPAALGARERSPRHGRGARRRRPRPAAGTPARRRRAGARARRDRGHGSRSPTSRRRSARAGRTTGTSLRSRRLVGSTRAHVGATGRWTTHGRPSDPGTTSVPGAWSTTRRERASTWSISCWSLRRRSRYSPSVATTRSSRTTSVRSAPRYTEPPRGSASRTKSRPSKLSTSGHEVDDVELLELSQGWLIS